MLTFLRSSTPVLVMISSMSVPICNHFHVRRAYSGKITLFKEVPLFRPPRSRGSPLLSGMKFCREIRETIGYHTVKTRSLYLTWSWIAIAMLALARKNYQLLQVCKRTFCFVPFSAFDAHIYNAKPPRVRLKMRRDAVNEPQRAF